MTEKKAYWNPIIVGSAAALNIALNFVLIPRWGMIGAGWATVVAYLFMNWFRWYMSVKFHPVAYEWGRVAKLLAVGLVMYAAIMAIPIANPYVSFAVRFALAATYPFVVAAIGFFEPRERARLAELWASAVSRLRRA
jgi:O-antigen/teichoic acid export membrane protein